VHDGQELQSFPASTKILESMEVKYQTLPGWKGSKTSGAKTWEELPPNCKAYVEFVEKRIGVKIKYIGTGMLLAADWFSLELLTLQVLDGRI
jgi:adenylosuccinate synthase